MKSKVNALYIFHVILLGFITHSCFTQELNEYASEVFSYSTDFPQGEVYDIVEDDEGYIWFATENGLYKHNGSSFQVFNEKDGIKKDGLLHLYKQEDNSLVGVGWDHLFYRIKNDKVSLLLPEDTISKYFLSTEYPFSFKIDGGGDYHIGTRNGYYEFSKTGRLKAKEKFNLLRIVVEPGEKEPFIYVLDHSLQRGVQKEFDIIYNGHFISKLPVDSLIKNSFYGSNGKGFSLVPCGNRFFVFRNDGTFQEELVGDEIITTNVVNDNLFIGVKNRGVLVYSMVDERLKFQYRLFDGLSISAITCNMDGNYWFATLEDGVRFIDLSTALPIFKGVESKNITSFLFWRNDLLVGFQSGELLNSRNKLKVNFGSKIHDIGSLDKELWVSSKYLHICNPNTMESISKSIGPSSLTTWNDSLVVKKGIASVFLENTKTNKTLFEIRSVRGLRTIKNYGKHLYIAADNQVKRISIDESGLVKKEYRLPDVLLFYEMNDSIYALTESGEIFHLDEKARFQSSLPYPSGQIRFYSAFYIDQKLFLGGNEGFYCWDISKGFTQMELIYFEHIPYVKNIKLERGSIYFSTSKNIFKKSLSSLKKQIPLLNLKSVFVDGKEVSDRSALFLTHNFTNARFSLETISFGTSNVRYRYRLAPSDDYIYTSDQTVNISTLPPGEYQLDISSSVDGVNYTESILIPIVVDAPFWRKPLFVASLILLLLAIVFVIYRSQLKSIRKKHKTNEMIVELKSQALSSQLNPHLIFNVMNSIQGLVSEGEIDQANSFIARFSKFMRSSLSYSSIQRVPIQKEIELTQQYIEIEKIRFEDEVEFKFSFDPAIKIEVPPLIIQPIIENAIKHGLMPSKEKSKTIELRIEQTQNAVFIRVIDNGVGFKPNFDFNVGMKLTKDRIKLLNPDNELYVDHNSAPTIVVLKLINEN